jgi:penicillin-binding protein 1A
VRTLIKLLVVTVVAGACLAATVAALAIPVEAIVTNGSTSVDNLIGDINAPRSERTTVYAADGTILAILRANENRVPITINRVPSAVINAVLDVEDARFWTHGAVDLKSTVRSLASDVRSGGLREGGSTITQQLVKNIFLTPHRDLGRKIKEAVIATRIEKKYTKRQILEAYLNDIYFGEGAFGVQAAAETYFNEDISQVTPVQAALIAGIIQDPSGYDPIQNPKDSKRRRDIVLDRMARYNHLTQQQADILKATPVPTHISKPAGTADTKDDYYVEQVKQILLNQSTTLGNTYTERYNALFRGGLKIYTNLDLRLQDLAEQKVAAGIPKDPRGFTGAMASIEPTTGKVRAIVGGPGFDHFQYDLATQASRQPGSGFKLFTLLAAYEAGYGPYDTVDGTSPCAIDFPGFSHDYLKKPAHNAEPGGGLLSVQSATAGSVNCAFLRIGHEVGLPKVIAMAHRLGLTENFTAVPSIVIGSEGVTVLQMAGAYATLADDGVYHQPSFIDHIVDRNGKTIFKGNEAGKRVLDPQIARMASSAFRAVVQYGTGGAAALPDRQVAGKTGTTENFSDAWFNGYTPQLATSVWMGDPKARTSMTNVGGYGAVFGGTFPARIWHDYTQAALSGQKAIDFPAPDPRKIPPGKFITSRSLQRDSPGSMNGFATTTTSPSVPKTTTTTGHTGTSLPPTGGPPTSGPPTTPPTTKPPHSSTTKPP